MLSLSKEYSYYLYPLATDMRCGYDGLSGLVINKMGIRLNSQSIFIFINRKRDQIRLLKLDSDGLSMYSKRLEKGTFEMPPVSSDTTQITLSPTSLLLILEGIQLSSIRKRKRYTKDS